MGRILSSPIAKPQSFPHQAASAQFGGSQQKTSDLPHFIARAVLGRRAAIKTSQKCKVPITLP